jgi:hypothetical protein
MQQVRCAGCKEVKKTNLFLYVFLSSRPNNHVSFSKKSKSTRSHILQTEPNIMKFSILAIAGFATSAAAFTPSAFMGKTQISKNVVKSTSSLDMKYTVAVVGGGPAGACAAEIFAAEKGINTFLFERKLDNAKPCGGAIPLCMIGEFNLPETVVDRKVRFHFV